MNRATQAEYPPGSTFKLLQALVGLQEKSINPRTEYACNGPQSTPIKCTHHHGSPVSLEAAIEQSCNPYFHCAFRDLLQKKGATSEALHTMYDRWWQDITSFGFSHKFDDSDISDQRAGSIPTAKLYDRIYGKDGWKAITIRSLSIGQGEILVTPLQLANQAACIANGGWYYSPHLLHNDTTHREKHYTRVDSCWFPIVKTGMHRVMTNGTGRWYNIDTLQMCGKTGTVQNPHGKDHAIFIGFAPQDDPKIAVAVVVENAGFGATWACPVATLMMEKYLTDTITNITAYKRMIDAVLIKQEE
jgi:penicillin-binding protein 2